MKPVIDNSGNVVQGLFRTPGGSLIVKDDLKLKKAMTERDLILNNKKDIESLKSEVSEIKSLLLQLINNKE